MAPRPSTVTSRVIRSTNAGASTREPVQLAAAEHRPAEAEQVGGRAPQSAAGQPQRRCSAPRITDAVAGSRSSGPGRGAPAAHGDRRHPRRQTARGSKPRVRHAQRIEHLVRAAPARTAVPVARSTASARRSKVQRHVPEPGAGRRLPGGGRSCGEGAPRDRRHRADAARCPPHRRPVVWVRTCQAVIGASARRGQLRQPVDERRGQREASVLDQAHDRRGDDRLRDRRQQADGARPDRGPLLRRERPPGGSSRPRWRRRGSTNGTIADPPPGGRRRRRRDRGRRGRGGACRHAANDTPVAAEADRPPRPPNRLSCGRRFRPAG